MLEGGTLDRFYVFPQNARPKRHALLHVGVLLLGVESEGLKERMNEGLSSW